VVYNPSISFSPASNFAKIGHKFSFDPFDVDAQAIFLQTNLIKGEISHSLARALLSLFQRFASKVLPHRYLAKIFFLIKFIIKKIFQYCEFQEMLICLVVVRFYLFILLIANLRALKLEKSSTHIIVTTASFINSHLSTKHHLSTLANSLLVNTKPAIPRGHFQPRANFCQEFHTQAT